MDNALLSGKSLISGRRVISGISSGCADRRGVPVAVRIVRTGALVQLDRLYYSAPENADSGRSGFRQVVVRALPFSKARTGKIRSGDHSPAYGTGDLVS